MKHLNKSEILFFSFYSFLSQPWQIFSKPFVKDDVVSSKPVEVNPITPINDEGPHEFYLPGYGNEVNLIFL